jgi:hypothetical protein
MDDIWTIPTTWRSQAAGRAGRQFHVMTMVVGMLKMVYGSCQTTKRCPNGTRSQTWHSWMVIPSYSSKNAKMSMVLTDEIF